MEASDSTCATARAALLFLVCAPASGDDSDFSGEWSASGHMVSGNMCALVSPVRDFRQSGDQPTGAGVGPRERKGREPAMAYGPTAKIGLAGISSFNGKLGPDNAVRGSWTFSGQPGVGGANHRAKAVAPGYSRVTRASARPARHISPSTTTRLRPPDFAR